MKRLRTLSPVVLTLLLVGCAGRHIDGLRKDLEEARAAESTEGVLSAGLDAEAQARLQLIGRTSAPTRYAEKTDANRIRVVAFDFGGAALGQRADIAGNLLSSSCLESGPPAPEQEGPAPNHELNKGMFRQYGQQVATTLDIDAALGPVRTEADAFLSHSFLVLEWRRYEMSQLVPDPCREPHVSGLETGIAVRIVFDVKLRSGESKSTAAFGIADLAAAVSRNAATVEVSYEVVGTSLDLLPDEPVIISSLNEYIQALEKFHAAVVAIRDAWRDYSKSDSGDVTVKFDGKQTRYKRDSLFTPGELAYYVDGPGVGDTFVHLGNVDKCQDIEVLRKHYVEQKASLEGEIDAKTTEIASLREELGILSTVNNSSLRAEIRRESKSRRVLARRLEFVSSRLAVLEMSSLQDDCGRTLEYERQRVVQACAIQNLDGSAYLGTVVCPDDDATRKDVEQATKRLKEIRDEQAERQQGQQIQERRD